VAAELETGEHRIRFDSPATAWTEALPIGGGLMGAMCFGDAPHERFLLNDTAGWSGGPATELSGDVPPPTVAQEAIARSRDAVARGDWIGADDALRAIQHGYPQSFLPFGELRLALTGRGASADGGYSRELDLRTAAHTTRAVVDGVAVRTTARISYPRKVLLVEIEVEGDGVLDVELGLSSPLRVLGTRDHADGRDLLLRLPSDVAPDKLVTDTPIRYSDGDQEAQNGAVALRWTHDGTGDGLRATGVRRAAAILSTGTNFVAQGAPLSGSAEDVLAVALARVEEAAAMGAEAVAAEQEADHGALYDRCTIEIGPGHDPGATTGERLRRALSGDGPALAVDPGLAALSFHLGRYLLICSSRDGGLPANLQGIWNDLMQPPWSSDYTTNINLEMNYWLAEQTDLPECLPPLFAFIRALERSGTETAGRVFGLPGWVAFHCSDMWAYTQSVGDGTHDPSWAFSPFTGPWLLQHVRERLRFGGDEALVREMWPTVRSAAEFYLGFVVEEPDGTLGVSPSTSPENHFTAPDGRRGATASSSTMDLTLVRDLFLMVGELAPVAGVTADDDVVRRAAEAVPRIPLPRTGADGMIREWADDALRPDPDHRHTAHLYFVHPGDLPLTPELAEGAERSLEGRGDASTGWSVVWKAAMEARLGHPDRVGALLRMYFRDATVYLGPYVGGVYPNLFAAHPPFQIDANLGFVAAIGEALVQSHAGAIDLLRGVPAELGTGRATGLVARPGVVVDLEWADGELVSAALTARPHGAGARRVRYRDRVVEVELPAGSTVRLDADAFVRA